ncbi:MAG: LysM peptidoglycan-binding domain-containing protein, partial [Eubacteriales bacterium]|nr:LysM peptidoglycan-binding domain-containing protein [Eubacteriales bacterium]
MYVVIQSYKASEEGGDVGTISYTVEMKEYRVPEVTKYKVTTKVEKKKKKTKAKKKSSGKRVDNKKKPKTYTVKKGDCLWNIAKKFYGNGAQYKKIYNANKNKIKNPNIIQIGWKLTIP